MLSAVAQQIFFDAATILGPPRLGCDAEPLWKLDSEGLALYEQQLFRRVMFLLGQSFRRPIHTECHPLGLLVTTETVDPVLQQQVVTSRLSALRSLGPAVAREVLLMAYRTQLHEVIVLSLHRAVQRTCQQTLQRGGPLETGHDIIMTDFWSACSCRNTHTCFCMSHQQALSHTAFPLPSLVSLPFQGLACVGPPLVSLAEGLFNGALCAALGNVQRAVQFSLRRGGEEAGAWTRLVKSFDGGRCLHGKGAGEESEGPARCACATKGSQETSSNQGQHHSWFVLSSTTTSS